MIDYSKLTHVASDWTGSKREAKAPKSVPDQASVLDNIDLRGKIVDSQKETDQPKMKVMIVDDTQIKKIMTAPRDEKRKILSRLSDSQRRRLLSRYAELSKIKDDETVNKLNYVNLDSILNDCVYVPDSYHIGLLDQWIDTYTVPDEIQGFVDAIKANDRTAIAANLDNYIAWCEANDVSTEIGLAKDVINNDEDDLNAPVDDSVRAEVEKFKKLIADAESKDLDDETKKAIKKAAQSDMASLESSDKSSEELKEYSIDAFVQNGYNYNKVAEAYNDAWVEGYKSQAADSKKKIATLTKKLSDAKKRITALEASLEKVQDNAQMITDSEKKIADLEAQLRTRHIMDDVIDQIAEKPLLNEEGEEVKPTEDRPIMAVLSEALEAYANGDSELLDKLASTTLNGDAAAGQEEAPAEGAEEVPAMDEAEEPAEEEPQSEDNPDAEVGASEDFPNPDEEENEDEEEGEDDGVPELNIGDSAEDSQVTPCAYEQQDQAWKDAEALDKENAKELVKLLKEIETGEIKDSVKLNALIDSMSDKCPALKKYNFRISDFTPVMSSYEPTMGLNPPLSRDEYYSLCPVLPDAFDLICQQQNYPLCPKCNEYAIQQNGVCVNPSSTNQLYYPFNCSLQAIADLLKDSAPENYTEILRQHCIPMSDAMHLAALTNNLGFIDNQFYKQHLNDSAWSFDVVPECLKGITDKAGKIKQSQKSDGTFCLFGVNFELV